MNYSVISNNVRVVSDRSRVLEPLRGVRTGLVVGGGCWYWSVGWGVY